MLDNLSEACDISLDDSDEFIRLMVLLDNNQLLTYDNFRTVAQFSGQPANQRKLMKLLIKFTCYPVFCRAEYDLLGDIDMLPPISQSLFNSIIQSMEWDGEDFYEAQTRPVLVDMLLNEMEAKELFYYRFPKVFLISFLLYEVHALVHNGFFSPPRSIPLSIGGIVRFAIIGLTIFLLSAFYLAYQCSCQYYQVISDKNATIARLIENYLPISIEFDDMNYNHINLLYIGLFRYFDNTTLPVIRASLSSVITQESIEFGQVLISSNGSFYDRLHLEKFFFLNLHNEKRFADWQTGQRIVFTLRIPEGVLGAALRIVRHYRYRPTITVGEPILSNFLHEKQERLTKYNTSKTPKKDKTYQQTVYIFKRLMRGYGFRLG